MRDRATAGVCLEGFANSSSGRISPIKLGYDTLAMAPFEAALADVPYWLAILHWKVAIVVTEVGEWQVRRRQHELLDAER